MAGQESDFPNLDGREAGEKDLSLAVVIVLAGSVLVALGCFAPLVNLPIVGAVTYFGNGHGDGVFAIGLAVVAAVLALLGKTRWSAVVGILELALIAFTFVTLYTRIADLGASTEAQLEGNPFKGLAGAMARSIGFSWAWVPLFVGAGMTAACRPLARLIRR